MNDPPVEELLEQLFLVEAEGAQDAADAPPEVVQAASAAKLVEVDGGKCRLTEAGMTAARDVTRRHRLAECLLRDVLGATADLDQDACEFEHIIKHGLDEKICVLLGHPSLCPHGKAIPRGPCCEKAAQDAFRDVGPLSDGQVGAEGVVAYLKTRDRRDVQKLMALGILPGVRVRLIRRFPSYVFQLGYSQFTVDRSLAEKIHVRWQGTGPPTETA